MVLISIRPYGLGKIFLIIAALLSFSALCFADPVLMAHRYDSDKAQGASSQTSFGADIPQRQARDVHQPAVTPRFAWNAGNFDETTALESTICILFNDGD